VRGIGIHGGSPRGDGPATPTAGAPGGRSGAVTPYFARHLITVVLFAPTVVVWVVSELWVQVRSARGRTNRDRGTVWLVNACIGAAWLTTAFAAARLPGAAMPGQPLPFLLGLVVAWGGIALRWSAFRALGRTFTFRVTTAPDQTVVSSGPYRILRHPSYTGLELVLLGIALLYGDWIGLAAMLILPMIGLLVRIHVEEQALEAALGQDYREFAAGRKRLIPFLW
jgi:protein-S-isoprenylcysteine O-methyltransferase Ste14